MKSISYKILRFNSILTIVTIVIVYSLFSLVMNHYLTNELTMKLENDTKAVKKLLEKDMPYEDINGIIQESKNNPLFKVIKGQLETSIAVMDISKKSGKDKVFYMGKGEHLQREELKPFEQGLQDKTKSFKITANNRHYLAVIYKLNNKKLMYGSKRKIPNTRSIEIKYKNQNINNNISDIAVVGYIDLANIERFKRNLSYIMLGGIVTVRLITFFMTWLFSKKMTSPLESLVAVTCKIGNRDFTEFPQINTGDELQVLSEAFKEMTDKIILYDCQQKEFFQDMAHELKTPLMSIRGYAEGIKDKVFEDEERALDIIIDESERIKKLVENIIYLTHLETNIGGAPEYTAFNSVETMIMSIQKIESLAIEKDIDIIFEPKEEVILSADKEQILRVFINILFNCVKYTKDSIEITINKEEQIVSIIIRDNGEGFSEEELRKVFDRFYKGRKEGTGIGMCIVKHIIEKHNGDIKIYNHEQGGAVFVVQLPL